MTSEKQVEGTVISRMVAFASTLWPRSAKREAQLEFEKKQAMKRKSLHQRARARSYINPWHNV